MTASKTKTTTASPIADPVATADPTPPTSPKKSEQLFVAYWSASGPVEDVVVFGRKVDALEYAMDQSPKWDVVAVAKGQSVKAAIAG